MGFVYRARPPQIPGNIQGMRTPYVDQWVFNVQRELARNPVGLPSELH